MCKTVTALQLAHYVLQYTTQRNIRITHLQLQKILYYIQGYHLREFGEPLFDDKIYAWPYGPVVRSVYVNYFIYGALPLRVTEPKELHKELHVDEKQKTLINRVVEDKTRFRAAQLVAATHSETPWRSLEEQVKAGQKPEITTESIKAYFATVR